MKSDLLDKVLKQSPTLQDRANLYAVVIGFLKARIGEEAFDEDVRKAIEFINGRLNLNIRID